MPSTCGSPSRSGSSSAPLVIVIPFLIAFAAQFAPPRGSAAEALSRCTPIAPGFHEKASL